MTKIESVLMSAMYFGIFIVGGVAIVTAIQGIVH